ncbi:MAG: SPFH domain-containing protein [Lachnospiraceae bacterium]|nr:SPFH domain-containing protein [Lachnospiraceae bacterium]
MAIVDVVKYNGEADLLAWKFPSEELGTWTQLIVNEAQEAVLFKDGKALDVFGSGRYTLETPNIPILNKVINLPFGCRSPFAAEVWFVNKMVSLDVKWGTPSPIQMQDPRYQIFVPVRANGMFGIQVEDSTRFLVKLVGTMPAFDRTMLVNYFRGLYVTKVKDSLSSYLLKKQISIMEINAYLDELSGYMKERIEPVMAEYGIRLVNFYVNEISVPEEDPSVQKLKDALAKKAEMNIIGFDYRQERSFNALEGAASNPGSSGALFMGAGIGTGMGLGMGSTMGSAFGEISREIRTEGAEAVPKSGQEQQMLCPGCGSRIPIRGKFCPECGIPLAKQCPKCGAAIEGVPRFCPECGERLNEK